MTKYTRVTKQPEERPWSIHPIWRGIGCAMIIIIVVLSYAFAKEFVDYNEKTEKLGLPSFIYKSVQISATKYVPALNEGDVIDKTLAKVKWGYVVFMAIFMFIGFGAFSFVYSAMYRVSGPARYSPLDSPEVRKPRAKKRY